MLISRTEELLNSKRTYEPCKISAQSPHKPVIQNPESEYPDVTDALKFRTESLLYSRTRKKKKNRHSAPPREVIPRNQEPIIGNNPDPGSGSWSNIPRCFNVTTSMLSSDAGISSMPSSMISNVSETEVSSRTNVAADLSTPVAFPVPNFADFDSTNDEEDEVTDVNPEECQHATAAAADFIYELKDNADILAYKEMTPELRVSSYRFNQNEPSGV